LSYADDDIKGCPVRVYELGTGKLRYALPSALLVFDVEFSSDGRLLATAHLDRAARIWDFASGTPAKECPESLPHSDWVFSVRFSIDNTLLLTASRDGMARLWNWRTGELVVPPMQHANEVFDAKFSPDGRWILTACADSRVYVRERATGQIVAPPMPHSERVWSLAIAPDGGTVLFAGMSQRLDVWSLNRVTTQASLPPEVLCEWFELVAGKALYEDSGVAPLTPGEWLTRWKTFRRRYSGTPAWSVIRRPANAKASALGPGN
jgi:WD40 repeat protein